MDELQGISVTGDLLLGPVVGLDCVTSQRIQASRRVSGATSPKNASVVSGGTDLFDAARQFMYYMTHSGIDAAPR